MEVSQRGANRSTQWVGVFAGLTLIQVAGAAVSASDPFVIVRATSSLGTAQVQIPLASASVFNDVDFDVWIWANTGPTPLFDGPNLIGLIGDTSVVAGRNTLYNNPGPEDDEVRWGIDLDFNVFGGAADTTWEIFTPTLTFDPVHNPLAANSAGLVGTDQNSDGITITPALGNGFGYESMYNGASLFRNYLDLTQSSPASGSVAQSGNMNPLGSFEQLVGSVSSLQYMYKFTVTANDSAAGTSTYAIVPAPGAAGLLGMGSLALLRRRSR